MYWQKLMAGMVVATGSSAFSNSDLGAPVFPHGCEINSLLRSDASPAITCQDVTATNRTFLQEVADHVVISSLNEGVLAPASFDIIFSTHCLEHVARPEALLTTCIAMLKPGGSLLLFAPRYDLPFYLSPSSANMRASEKILLSLRLHLIRLFTVLRGEPAFVIDTNPAASIAPSCAMPMPSTGFRATTYAFLHTAMV
jgi:SAM-dependent methyltransferase